MVGFYSEGGSRVMLKSFIETCVNIQNVSFLFSHPQAAFVVHVFPPCEFADNVLLNAAPDLYRKVQETAYLVCIIVTV